MLVPSAFTPATGSAHWETLLRARAIENQCFVIAAAQVGSHNPRRTSYGHSIVIDPWGKVVASLDGETEGVCFAELDKAQLEKLRSDMPVLRHKRADIYGGAGVGAGKPVEVVDCAGRGEPIGR